MIKTNAKRFEVLLVDDDLGACEIIRQSLACQPQMTEFSIESVNSLAAAIEALQQRAWDVVLLDANISGKCYEASAVEKICAVSRHVPVVALLPFANDEVGIEVIRKGASDCLAKGGDFFSGALVRAIQYSLERKELERKFIESSQRLDLALRGAELGLWDWDIANDRFIVDDRGAQIMGLSSDEIGTSFDLWKRLIHPDDLPAVKKSLRAHISGRTPLYQAEYRLRVRKLDKWKWILDRGKVMERDRNGRSRRAMGAHLDITERKKAEEKIKESMEIKSEFISTVSHELRTPLAAIKEGISIIWDGSAGTVSKEQKNFLDVAKRNVDRLARLVNDVLDFQRLDAGIVKFDMKLRDINDAVREVYSLMLPTVQTKYVNFELQVSALPKVRFDRDRIIQVITNLVGNAIKFTNQGSVKITTSRGDNIVIVSVSDTGVGISRRDLTRLFRRFSRLEQPEYADKTGSGLGLVISKEIIRQHGGKIWVESEAGRGATFNFLLPIRERRARLREDDEVVLEHLVGG